MSSLTSKLDGDQEAGVLPDIGPVRHTAKEREVERKKRQTKRAREESTTEQDHQDVEDMGVASQMSTVNLQDVKQLNLQQHTAMFGVATGSVKV